MKRPPSVPPFTACPKGGINIIYQPEYFEGMFTFAIAIDRENAGWFIAEVQEIPGALADAPQVEAKANVQALAPSRLGG